MTKKKYRDFFSIITIVFIIITLFFPQKISAYCKDSLIICARSLIPAIFIFTVLSKLLSALSVEGLFSGKTSELFSCIFNLPRVLIPTCLLGLICSAPSGASAIGDIYEKGYCSKEQAERAAVLANNCSAAFIMGVAGAITGSSLIAATILVSEILSVIIIYMLLFRDGHRHHTVKEHHILPPSSTQRIICESISSSAEISLKICAYVLFFSAIGKSVCDAFYHIFPHTLNLPYIKGIIVSFFEMTTGISLLADVGGYEAILLTGSAVSFCGLSIIFQVSGLLGEKGLSSKHFVLSRILSSMLTPLIILLILFLLPDSLSVIAYAEVKKMGGFSFGDAISLTIITVLFIIAAVFISVIDKKHKK